MATGMELSEHGKKFCGAVLLLALIGGAGVAPAWAQKGKGEGLSVQPGSPPKINRDLPGSKKGTMTSVKNGIVRIDRETYALAPDALVEDTKGEELLQKELAVYNGFDQEVQYWLETGQAANQIIQMIVRPPQ